MLPETSAGNTVLMGVTLAGFGVNGHWLLITCVDVGGVLG